MQEFEFFLRRLPTELYSDALTWWNPPLPQTPAHLSRLLVKGRYVVEGGWGGGLGSGVGRYEVVRVIKELLGMGEASGPSVSATGGVLPDSPSPPPAQDTQDTFSQESTEAAGDDVGADLAVETEVAHSTSSSVRGDEEAKNVVEAERDTERQKSEVKEDEGNFLDFHFYPAATSLLNPLPLPFNLNLLPKTLAPILEEFVNTNMDESARAMVEGYRAAARFNAQKVNLNCMEALVTKSLPLPIPRSYIPSPARTPSLLQYPRGQTRDIYPVPPAPAQPAPAPVPAASSNLPTHPAIPAEHVYPLLSRRFLCALDKVPPTHFQTRKVKTYLRYALEELINRNDCQESVVNAVAQRWKINHHWLNKWVYV